MYALSILMSFDALLGADAAGWVGAWVFACLLENEENSKFQQLNLIAYACKSRRAPKQML